MVSSSRVAVTILRKLSRESMRKTERNSEVLVEQVGKLGEVKGGRGKIWRHPTVSY